MNKLLTTIATILFTGVALCGAEIETETEMKQEVHQSGGYFSFSAGFPAIFTIDVGKRVQHNHHGFDAGVGITPVLFAYEAHAYTNYLFYPNPNLDSQGYFGIGTQIGWAQLVQDWDGLGFLKPQIVFGKEYTKFGNEKRFIQGAIGAVYITTKGIGVVPSLTVTYGIKF